MAYTVKATILVDADDDRNADAIVAKALAAEERIEYAEVESKKVLFER